MSDDPSSGQDWQSGDSGMGGGASTWQSTRPGAAPPPAGGFGVPTVPPIERLHAAYQRRHDTDYIANFWSALGWGILTVGFFYLYMYFQLIRRMRDHNARRLDLLDAANAYAWEVAGERGLQEELGPHFERTAGDLESLRFLGTRLKDPVIWFVIYMAAFWFTSAMRLKGANGRPVTASRRAPPSDHRSRSIPDAGRRQRTRSASTSRSTIRLRLSVVSPWQSFWPNCVHAVRLPYASYSYFRVTPLTVASISRLT